MLGAALGNIGGAVMSSVLKGVGGGGTFPRQPIEDHIRDAADNGADVAGGFVSDSSQLMLEGAWKKGDESSGENEATKALLFFTGAFVEYQNQLATQAGLAMNKAAITDGLLTVADVRKAVDNTIAEQAVGQDKTLRAASAGWARYCAHAGLAEKGAKVDYMDDQPADMSGYFGKEGMEREQSMDDDDWNRVGSKVRTDGVLRIEISYSGDDEKAKTNGVYEVVEANLNGINKELAENVILGPGNRERTIAEVDVPREVHVRYYSPGQKMWTVTARLAVDEKGSIGHFDSQYFGTDEVPLYDPWLDDFTSKWNDDIKDLTIPASKIR
jgi:hypothetical protein